MSGVHSWLCSSIAELLYFAAFKLTLNSCKNASTFKQMLNGCCNCRGRGFSLLPFKLNDHNVVLQVQAIAELCNVTSSCLANAGPLQFGK